MCTVRILGPVFALLVLLPPGLPGQTIPRELRQAMEQRHQAISQADARAWDRLTADDFTVVLADGRLQTKSERLAELRTQSPAPLAATEQEHLQRFADVVVRRMRVGDLWVLESWVRGERGWQVSSTQLTRAGGATRQAVPTHSIVRFFKCSPQGAGVQLFQRWRPIAQQMIAEGKFLDYGILAHSWGDEWNVVDYFTVDDLSAFFDNFSEYFRRAVEAAGGQEEATRAYSEVCTEHKDIIYTVVPPPEGR